MLELAQATDSILRMAQSIGILIALAFIVFSVAGLACLVIGLRGRAVFSAPTCAKCGYDLRAMNFMSADIATCPECGAKLDTPRAVSFGRLQRWRGMIVAGIVMLVLPWLSLLLLIPTMRSARGMGPAASASLSNQALLAKLPTTIDEPWDWRELERRLAAGTLSTTEAESAIAALTTRLVAQRAKGQPTTYLPWSGSFVKAALQLQGFDAKRKQAFLQAFHGVPKVTMRKVMRQNDLRVQVQYSTSDFEGMQSCWVLNKVVADGATPMTVKDRYRNGPDHPDMRSGSERYSHHEWQLAEPLSPGEHELVFVFDMGVVPAGAQFRGMDGRPGSAEKWPSPVAQWQETITHKINVVAQDQPLVKVVEDESIDPRRDVGIAVQSAVVRPSQGGSQLALKWKYASPLQIPLVYRIEGMAGGQKIDCGQFVLVSQNNGSMTSISDVRDIPKLPPEAKTLDLKLIPSPKIAEGFEEIDQILGGEVEIKNIPLERYDLTQ